MSMTTRQRRDLARIMSDHERDIEKLKRALARVTGGSLDADTLDGIDSTGFSLAAHDHDLDYSDILHDHDADYADIAHTHTPRVVDEGLVYSTNLTSLSAQNTYVSIDLSKTFSGLSAAKTYRLACQAHVSLSTVTGGTDHRYAGRWDLGGTQVSACLGEVADSWGHMSSSRVETFTGVTSYTLAFLGYSYATTGTGRVYWRDLSWTLTEV